MLCNFAILQERAKKNKKLCKKVAKKFAKPKMFDVSLSSKSEMTKSQYSHVRDANVVRMGMARFSYENVKLLNR